MSRKKRNRKAKTQEQMKAIELVRREQRLARSIGYTTHQDLVLNRHGQLLQAALCYLMDPTARPLDGTPPHGWPWERASWRPRVNRIQELVKAAQLLLAHIDMLQVRARDRAARDRERQVPGQLVDALNRLTVAADPPVRWEPIVGVRAVPPREWHEALWVPEPARHDAVEEVEEMEGIAGMFDAPDLPPPPPPPQNPQGGPNAPVDIRA